MTRTSLAILLLSASGCAVSAPPPRTAPNGEPNEPSSPVAVPDTSDIGANGVPDTTMPTPEGTASPPEVPDTEAGGCNTKTAPAENVCTAAFVPDTGPEEFERVTTTLVTVTQGPANHRGMDAVYNPGEEQILIAKFAYGPFDADLVHEKVEVWIERQCGSWDKVGTVWTSDDDELPDTNGISDSGGRVFFHVPAEKAVGIGNHRVKMLVKGDHSEANFTLRVWPKGESVVVTDIDGKMTTQETDGVWTWLDANAPGVQVGAAEMMQAYAAKGFHIVYLTARPEHLTTKTRQWFDANGFPDGTFHLSESKLGETGTAAHDYKLAFLEWLSLRGAVVESALGNKDTDLGADLDAGLSPGKITLIEGEFSGDPQGATLVRDYVTIAQTVGCMAPR
jgi:phosphatidate phosphatase PAH1